MSNAVKRTELDANAASGLNPATSPADGGTGQDSDPAEGPPARNAASDGWVPLLFLASGAAGLIYQVVWTQDLVLVFGNTTQAVVTTVTAFLAGLGIGALVGAAIGPRLRHVLVVYGLAETAVGCLALLMPLAFDLIATLFRHAYLSLPPLEVALIRFALAFVALTPVTLIMGMTLPILTRHLVRSDPDVGVRIARLYGLNTLGAVVGSVASGFILIEFLGLRGTTYVAVALNIGAGVGAVLISRTLPKTVETRSPVTKPRSRLQGRQRLLLAVTFASGLVSLALEVLWTRVMLQGTGSSIYVFVAVVTVFLIGIAAGSLVYERQKHRAPQMAALGACLALAAGLALVPLVLSNITGPDGLPVAVAFILPVTALLGYAFPLTVRLFVDSAAVASRGVGFVYAANTAGCVVGTVTAGFVLIPTVGANASILILCLVQATIGTALVIRFARGKLLQPILGGLVTAVLVLMFFVPAARLTYVQRAIVPAGARTQHFEDSAASVDVAAGTPLSRNLLINGRGITRLTIDTKLLAYIPKVLRPNATSMLTICFGMGTTYRSSIILGLHTTAVELDPTVPTVMSWFYSDASRYIRSPLGHIVISDGRNYVRLSNKRYDLITIDAPPPVWSAGTVVLMTHEFYQEALQRLAPGGVLASFIPNSRGFQKLFYRTFEHTFRYVTVIHGANSNYGNYLIGSEAPLRFSASAIKKVFGTPAAQADLNSAPDYSPVPLASWPSVIRNLVWLTGKQVKAYAGRGPILTDNRPLSAYFLFQGYSDISLTQPVINLAAVLGAMLGLLVIGLLLDTLRRARPRGGIPTPG